MDLALPGWPVRRGPLVSVPIAGLSHYQQVLERLPCRGGEVPLALFPEPDNPHDAQAVAVVAAGQRIGYLGRSYAVLWHPVVRACMAAGWAVTGTGRVIRSPSGFDVRARFLQPAPLLPGEPAGAPLPIGQDAVARFWPTREVTVWVAWRRQRAKAAARRDRARRMAAEEEAYRRWCMGQRLSAEEKLMAAYAWGRRGNAVKWIRQQTPTESRLWHYLAQCPYNLDYQIPLASFRADFFCPAARLAIEVDGPEHQHAERTAADAERDQTLSRLAIATMRVNNSEVNTDPVRVARRILSRICRRTQVPAPSNPASPFHGWAPLPPLAPRRSSTPRK